MVQWCWVNCYCRGVQLIRIGKFKLVGQGPTAPTVGAGGGCLDFFFFVCHFFFLSSFFWETARDRLKYCLKGWLRPKQPIKIQEIQELKTLSAYIYPPPQTHTHTHTHTHIHTHTHTHTHRSSPQNMIIVTYFQKSTAFFSFQCQPLIIRFINP